MGIIKGNLINSAVARNRIVYGGGLNLAECQMPTKTTLSLLLQLDRGEKDTMKGWWVEIRAGEVTH